MLYKVDTTLVPAEQGVKSGVMLNPAFFEPPPFIHINTVNMPEKSTYITYNEGLEAKHLHLGNLVHDFKDPNDHDPYVEKSYTDISEPPPAWVQLDSLQNYALTLGKDGDRHHVAAAAKTTKLEIKNPEKFFENITLHSTDAKKWISSRLSAAETIARPPPQIWMLTGLILMQHATWTSLSSDQSFTPGLQAPFDPTGVSAIRRSSVSDGVRPTFGLEESEKRVSGAIIHETGKYPGTRGWAAQWEKIEVEIAPAKNQDGVNHIQLKGPKVAVLEVGEYAEDVGGEEFDDAYWDALLDAADE